LTDLTLIICYIHNGDASTQDGIIDPISNSNVAL